MIETFACKETSALFRGERTRKFPASILVRAREQLFMLAAAISMSDLRVPPGNRLEALHGDRKGQYSIRVNQAWRICFRWHADNVFDVELTNHYH